MQPLLLFRGPGPFLLLPWGPTDRGIGGPSVRPTDRPTGGALGGGALGPRKGKCCFLILLKKPLFDPPRGRPTDRPTGGPTGGPGDRGTDRPTDRGTGGPGERPTDRRGGRGGRRPRPKERKTALFDPIKNAAFWSPAGPTDRPTGRPTDRRTREDLVWFHKDQDVRYTSESMS